MVIKYLVDFYQQRPWAMPNSGWSLQNLKWIIVINENGFFHEVIQHTSKDEPAGIPQLLPSPIARSGINSHEHPFQLWDHAGFVTGHSENNHNQAKMQHENFIRLVQCIYKNTSDLAIFALIQFLTMPKEKNKLKSHRLFSKMLKSGNITFQLKGDSTLLCHRPVVYKYLSAHPLKPSGHEGQCLVCGQSGTIIKTHGKFKNIKGTSASGAPLITVNHHTNTAFGAYALEAAFGAPTCDSCHFKYSSALRELLKGGSQNKIQWGDFTVLFWSSYSKFDHIFKKLLIGKPEYPPEPIRSLSDRISKLNNNDVFYLLVLHGRGRRIVCWYEGKYSLEQVKKHCNHWLQESAPTETFPLMGIQPFIVTFFGCQYSSNKKRHILHQVNKYILINTLLLLVDRVSITLPTEKVNKRLNKQGATKLNSRLLLFFLYCSGVKDKKLKENIGEVYGKLVALLEYCQKTSRSQSNTIRCSSAVIASPQQALPLFWQLNQHHLNVIGLFSPGLRVNLEKMITETSTQLGIPPASLNSYEQLFFWVGYHSQKCMLYSKKSLCAP